MEQKKSFIQEFKEFITKGNVMDLAIGIIIGSAFTSIVSSLVKDILTPILSLLTGKINFSELKIIISPATDTKIESAIYYGNFLQNLISFLLISFTVFMLIKFVNKFKKKDASDDSNEITIPQDIKILAEIRDFLKKES